MVAARHSLQPVDGRVVRRDHRRRIPVQVHERRRRWRRRHPEPVDGLLVRGRHRSAVVHVGGAVRVVVQRRGRYRVLVFGELVVAAVQDVGRRRCRVCRAGRAVLHRHVAGRRRVAVVRVMTAAVAVAGHGYRHDRRGATSRQHSRRHATAGRLHLTCAGREKISFT